MWGSEFLVDQGSKWLTLPQHRSVDHPSRAVTKPHFLIADLWLGHCLWSCLVEAMATGGHHAQTILQDAGINENDGRYLCNCRTFMEISSRISWLASGLRSAMQMTPWEVAAFLLCFDSEAFFSTPKDWLCLSTSCRSLDLKGKCENTLFTQGTLWWLSIRHSEPASISWVKVQNMPMLLWTAKSSRGV